MRQFEIVVENRVGALADVCEVLAKAKLHLKGVSTELKDGIGIIRIITDDEELTRKALQDANLDFSEYEIVRVTLRDKTDEMSRLTRALANLNVDIEGVFLMDRKDGVSELAFKVNDLQKAKSILD